MRSLTRGATWSIASNKAGVGMIGLADAAGAVAAVVKGCSDSVED
jgi:hypothetical protein